MQLTTVLALLPLLASTSLDVPVRASADPMRKLLAIVPTQPSTHNLSSPSPSYQTSAKVANTGSAADSSSAANTSSANTSSAVSACGKDNQPACRADPPKHMLPYCTEPGVTAIFSAWPIGLQSDDSRRQLQGWCWKIAPDCGTGVGKPCCPSGYHMSFNPMIRTDVCSGSGNDDFKNPKGALKCQADPKHPATIKYQTNAILGYTAGTCVKQAPDCGEIGKSCCTWVAGCCTVARCIDDKADCVFNQTTMTEKCVLK